MRSALARWGRELAGSARVRLDRLGPSQDARRTSEQARDYWTTADAAGAWASNSHWREGLGEQQWHDVGREHVALIHTFARGLGRGEHLGTVVDWGCGGGANAVALAPFADRLVLADVAAQSVEEAAAQVRAVRDVDVRGVTIDLLDPERAAHDLAGTADTFVCLYVIELTASTADALRIVQIAEQTLRPGGLAVLQIKYRSTVRSSGHVKRGYRRNLANMTIFPIPQFWGHLEAAGLTPRLVTLVPENELDHHYAYFAATKP